VIQKINSYVEKEYMAKETGCKGCDHPKKDHAGPICTKIGCGCYTDQIYINDEEETLQPPKRNSKQRR
jgi:hypothetical protein